MNATARYTISIFFGVLISLVFMFSLFNFFPSTKKPVKQQANATSVPLASANPNASLPGANDTETPVSANTMLQKVEAEISTITGKPASEMVLDKQEPVTWPSSALGCPKPGFFYAQVNLPGYRIVVSIDGETFEYHTDLSDQIQLCSDTRE